MMAEMTDAALRKRLADVASMVGAELRDYPHEGTAIGTYLWNLSILIEALAKRDPLDVGSWGAGDDVFADGGPL